MSMPRAAALRYLWMHHRWGVIGFGAALILALLFAVRLTVFTLYWADPAHRNQPIAGWMTPGYVARSYDVDPAVIRAALPITPAARSTLADIAERSSIPLPVLLTHIDDAIRAAAAP
jgi:hypothetical protein